MNRLLAVTALVALVASPALAQTQTHRALGYAPAQGAYSSYWQFGREFSSVGSPYHTVIVGGRYIGMDPDPSIRVELLRDSADGW